MATRSIQSVTLDDGLFRVVYTYDDVTMRLSRVDITNDSDRDRTVSVAHPVSGQVFSLLVAAHTTAGRSIPGNRTFRLWDSREQGGVDDWPTLSVV
jgi:hypothetical protein